ncbi:alanine--tRNA ligase [Magnetospirillum moscoviense]|uniref:Alanine--tRNA ligase n=1 Tax=Magnetospirillum moscoviense TaxID=1437059 RepID=A0A178MUE4_9PROT|nr:alanine--tRNA ligase [Magnetospirillum moscoviense]OAN52436.1 alanine--tRNA ligase [Magnetospirillum moscoviense]
MQTANTIRRAFLDYFGKNGHEVVSSSPLVPRNDPTLMFTNAGMVQFKNVFTGIEKRDYVRAATSQKCVRAGGKHNDLDNVGYTARHHTFFEMLGNFSFGDYFKDRAIELAWNLITKEFGLPKDKLLVTVYHDDDEAFNAWKKIAGFSDDRIIRIPTSDNFWAMGDTGPCGPCSEIFFDHGEHIPGGPPGSPDQDGDRFIEIWNLVFMQFEQVDKATRIPLPKPSIDTGMGLERLAAVLQGQHDNYDIDLMRALIEASANASGADVDGPHKVSHRVVADHLRSSCFLIADGVLPSNEGRGYVLRRIMRRAMRHAHLMGCTDPLLWKLVPALIAQMGDAYPELGRAGALITETLKLEETRFKATLDKGLKLLDDELTRLGSGQKLAGEVAFKLYDTYGFPLDLTQDALKAKGIGVDTDGFAAAMERQRAEARKAWSGSGEAATETLWFETREKVGASEFLGYDATDAEGKIVALVESGKAVEAVHPGHEVMVVANQTPFYGESGGQMGDAGIITIAGGKACIVVRDTLKKLGDLIVHVGTVEGGPVTVGEDAHFAVDVARRDATRGHHSATHLLHAALRAVLGDHVTQKGSQVGADRLRFDFAHPKALSHDELRAVEIRVNDQVRKNAAVGTKLMTPDAAIEAGAMALFGEKYGEEVRVVSMGDFSVELCGGTHVGRTGDIGGIKVLAESAVAAGVRRIEAVTGSAFLVWANEQEELLAKTASVLKAAPADLPVRVASLIEDRRRLERELAETRKQMATGGGGGGGAAVKQVAGINFSGRVLDGVPAKDLKGMADEIKKQIGSGVVALVATDGGKASLVVAVTDDLTGRFSAVDLVRVGSEAVGGKGGGGRPDMAQAGGPDAALAAEAVARIEAALAG